MKRWQGEQPARDAILKALADDPIRTAAELAAIGQCSRQRVHQILNAEGLRLPTVSQMRKARGLVIRPVSRVIPNGPTVHINHTTAGTIAELLVAADLMARGWLVFFPLVRTAKCDLIAMLPDGSTLKRIEARSARRTKTGRVMAATKLSDACDHHAYVIADSPVEYVPPI